MKCDLSYYRQRAGAERTAALNSRHPQARRVHAAMAECYEEIVRSKSSSERVKRLEKLGTH
jgi:hypothetical protein